MKTLLLLILLFPILTFAQQPRANQIRFTPSGTISGTNLQLVIDEIDDEKAGKNINWIVKDANYAPTLLDTILSNVGFLMRSTSDISFTILSSSVMNFYKGTSFIVRNDSIGSLSLLEGEAVNFKCAVTGPWTLEEDEYVIITKINLTNTWTLELFKKPNISQQTSVAIYTETSTVGNVTTGEDILFTDTIPAGTLSANGNSVRGRFSGQVANNANTKTARLSFGDTDIVTRSTTTPTIGQGWTLDWECIRVDVGNQKCNGTFIGSDGIASAWYTAATADLTGDVIITLTGEATATNDIVKHTASGTFIPGAGEGTTPPPIIPPEIPFVIVDDRVLGVQGYQHNYQGSGWASCTGCAGEVPPFWYQSTLDYTATTNSYVEFTFNGTRIQWFTEKKSTHGIVEVSLDGVVVDTVDLYSAAQSLQTLVFDTEDADDPDNEEGPLVQEVHTIKLRCTGTKNASSSNFFLITDYFKVFNPEDVPDEEIPDPPDTATDFVALTGSDGGGNNCNTVGTPCRTIVYALTQMTSGDILQVAAGNFVEAAYIVPSTGESIQGAGVDQTIISLVSGLQHDVTAGGVDQTKCVFQYTAAGSTAQFLKNLTIDGSGKIMHGGVFIDGDRNNVSLLNVKISNMDYFGAFVAGNDHNFTNVQIINSAEAHTSFSTGNLMYGASEDFMCDNVDISDNSGGYGTKSWGALVLVERHTFKNGEIRVLPTSPYGGTGLPNIAFEFESANPRNCVLENNYIDNTISIVRQPGFANAGVPTFHVKKNIIDMITKGGGNAISTPLEFTVHNGEISENHIVGGAHAYIVGWSPAETINQVNLKVHHNTFYSVGQVNTPTGYIRNSYVGWTGLYVYNNTFHIPPTTNTHTVLLYTGCCGFARTSSDVQVKNNVIYDQSTADTGLGGANVLTRQEGSGGGYSSSAFTHNVVNGMSTTMPAGFTVSNTLTGAPGFTGSGVNPSPFVYDPFYRPTAGSICIDSGVDVGLPFTAPTPDRGRLEP